MIELQTFVGGIFDTNCYVLRAPGGQILVDAPTGVCDWLEEHDWSPSWLLITHGHVDHIDDAARVQRKFQCKVGYHRDSVPLITDPNFFKKFGFFLEAEPIKPDFLIEETENIELLGFVFRTLLVPGHCPGSLGFYLPQHRLLFGGDILFAGSIGRTDLPGGDHELLLKGIREKIYTLPDDTTVLPGHGPPTTVGEEKRTNPFVRG
jgi:glyoxylase-like metal-dependent hydrolase (beta-lactamase superfamily II)